MTITTTYTKNLTDPDVVCVAHVTNSMAVAGDDFEKGAADGTDRILELVAGLVRRLRPAQRSDEDS